MALCHWFFSYHSEPGASDPRDKTTRRSPKIPGQIAECFQVSGRKGTQENEIELDPSHHRGKAISAHFPNFKYLPVELFLFELVPLLFQAVLLLTNQIIK